MTILPNKSNKCKSGQQKESGPNERKRSRAALTHPGQKSTLQKGKNKIKQRRENPRTVQSTEQQREIATEYQVTFPASPVPPLVPSPSARLPTPSHSKTEKNDDDCNSGDEYEKSCTYSEERENEFRRILKKDRGFDIIEVEPDGACLFRSVSDQLYGDQEMHVVVRKSCCDYMEMNQDYFQHFITEDFEHYIRRKRQPHTHGNHVEIQAMSEQYCRLFEIYEYSTTPKKTFEFTDEMDAEPQAPIRLSYHNGNHYNSVRDPYRATIGLGLGIAGLNEGGAETSLMNQAIEASVNETERRMLLDKAKLTDYQATDQALLAQVARDSLQEYYTKKKPKGSSSNRSLNRIRNSPSSSPGPGTSRLTTSPPRPSPKPSPPPPPSLPPPPAPSVTSQTPSQMTSQQALMDAIAMSSNISDQPGPSTRNDSQETWALSDWISENDEDQVLAAILQQSAEEYFKN